MPLPPASVSVVGILAFYIFITLIAGEIDRHIRFFDNCLHCVQLSWASPLHVSLMAMPLDPSGGFARRPQHFHPQFLELLLAVFVSLTFCIIVYFFVGHKDRETKHL